MSDQLWGECPYCTRRKRLTKGGLLYGHKNRGGYDCFGGGCGPVDGSVRAAPVTPPKVDVVDAYTDERLIGASDADLGFGFWDRYYWCVVGTGLMLLLGVGAFAAGVIWGRR